jgi:hypothetical protein
MISIHPLWNQKFHILFTPTYLCGIKYKCISEGGVHSEAHVAIDIILGNIFHDSWVKHSQKYAQ